MNYRKTVSGCLGLSMLIAILCSCTATSVNKTWKSPNAQPPAGKIAVIAVDDRGLLRKGFENRFVAQLETAGAPAAVTYDQLSLTDIKQDKKAAEDHFRSMGADAVLILRLASKASTYREIQPGGERYAATIEGFGSTGWYNYYSLGFMSMSPTYGSSKDDVYLETVLYDLNSERRVWSGITKTVVKEGMDRVAEMDPLIQKIVAAMKKDGAIR